MRNTFTCYIGTAWKESDTTLKVRNPFNNDVVGVTFLASEDNANDAIQAAVRAFDKTKRLSGRFNWQWRR